MRAPGLRRGARQADTESCARESAGHGAGVRGPQTRPLAFSPGPCQRAGLLTRMRPA